MIPKRVKNILIKDLKKYKTLVENTEGETQQFYNKVVKALQEILEE